MDSALKVRSVAPCLVEMIFDIVFATAISAYLCSMRGAGQTAGDIHGARAAEPSSEQICLLCIAALAIVDAVVLSERISYIVYSFLLCLLQKIADVKFDEHKVVQVFLRPVGRK